MAPVMSTYTHIMVEPVGKKDVTFFPVVIDLLLNETQIIEGRKNTSSWSVLELPVLRDVCWT